MSSHISSPKHFNSVEYNLRVYLIQDKIRVPYKIYKRIPALAADQDTDEFQTEIRSIMNTLRKITVLCVTLQYAHHYEGKVDEEIKRETDELLNTVRPHIPLTLVGLYKAMQSLSYQIELDHLKDIRDLTKEEEDAMFFLKHMLDALAHHIASHLDEYDNAKWCID